MKTRVVLAELLVLLMAVLFVQLPDANGDDTLAPQTQTESEPPSPLSQYTDKLTELVHRELYIELADRIGLEIEFKVNAKGQIYDVVNRSKTKSVAHQSIMEQLRKLAPVERPPKPPLQMRLQSKVNTNEVYIAADVDFGPYMAELQRRIKSHWSPPKRSRTKQVVVVFKVFRSGKMDKLRLDKGSGDPMADEECLTAVRQASPLAPLPDGAPADVDIQFTFDYNVFLAAAQGDKSGTAAVIPKGISSPLLENLAKSAISNNKNRPWVTTPDLADQDYVNTMQERIAKNWTPQPGWETKEANLAFTMNKEGAISDLKVEKGDAGGEFEKAALKAIESGAPFVVPPAGAPDAVHFVIWF